MKLHLVFTTLLIICSSIQLGLCEESSTYSDAAQAQANDFIESESPADESGEPPAEGESHHAEGGEQNPTLADDYLDYISNGGKLPEEEGGDNFQDQDDPDLPQNQMEDDGTGQYNSNEDYPFNDDDELPYQDHGLTVKGLLYNHYQKFSNKTEVEKKLMLSELIPNFDTDEDGMISLPELKAWVERESISEITRADPEEFGWSQVDTDKDDKVSVEEAKADFARQMDGREEIPEKEVRYEELRFKHADLNGDKHLDKQEYIRYIMPDSFMDMKDFTIEHYTNEFDMDNNGKISRDEYISNSMYHTEGEEAQSESITQYEEERFHSFDADGNGALEAAEITTAALEHSTVTTVHRELEKMFQTMNEDHDQFVGRAELMKHHELLTTDAERQEKVPSQSHPNMLDGEMDDMSSAEMMEEGENLPPPPPEMMEGYEEEKLEELEKKHDEL